MTARCPGGNHDFPVDDEWGAYCDEHGVAMDRKSDWTLPAPTEEGSRGEHDVPVAPSAD
ncbi:hypothetical protein ACFV3E_05740 [Streptomyces sp. NPDC059718]